MSDGCEGNVLLASTVGRGIPSMVVKIHLAPCYMDLLPKGTRFVLRQFTLSFDDAGPCIVGCLHGGDLMPLILAPRSSNNMAELFSGLGGWSSTLPSFGADITVAVEKNEEVARMHALTAKIEALPLASAIGKLHQKNLPRKFILIADLEEELTWYFLSWLKIAFWLASPPCQSWSTAGHMEGLASPNGSLIKSTTSWMMDMGAKAILLENVPGLTSHQDFDEVKKNFHAHAYHLVLDSVEDVFPIQAIHRTRWLGLAVPKDIQLSLSTLEYVKAIHLPKVFPQIGMNNSMMIAGVFNDKIQEWEWPQLIPTPAAVEMAKDNSFVPRALRKGNKLLGREEIMAMRTISHHQPIPSIMASYMRQHEISRHLLAKNGLHVWFVQDLDKIRYATPHEVAFAMGHPSNLVLPLNYPAAFQMVGNSLAYGHAALLIWKTHLLMGDDSPFVTSIQHVNDLAKHILDRQPKFCERVAVRRDNVVTIEMACGDNFAELRLKVISTEAQELAFDRDVDTSDMDNMSDSLIEPTPAKVQKTQASAITPTVPYEVDAGFAGVPILHGDDLVGLNIHPDRLRITRPDDSMIEELKIVPDDVLTKWEEGQVIHVANMHPVQILHSSGCWSAAAWTKDGVSVRNVFQLMLPHVVDEHILAIQYGVEELDLDDLLPPCEDVQTVLMFEPQQFDRLIVPDFVAEAFIASVDCCWTFRDLCAFVAAKCNALVTKVGIFDGDAQMPEAAYVVQQFSTQFRAALLPATLEVKQLIPRQACPLTLSEHVTVEGIRVRNPLHSENALTSDAGHIRIAARCPKWGTIRPISCRKDMHVELMTTQLFPHMCDDARLSIVVNSASLAGCTKIEQLLKYDHVEVHFIGPKPWPAAKVELLVPFVPGEPQDPECTTKVWIKGPFDHRAKLQIVDLDWTVTRVAAAYQTMHKSTLTMFATQHGKGVDSRLTFRQICTDHELHIRACALPGGARNTDDIAKVLEPLLRARGVPPDSTPGRIKTILSKIDHAELRAALSDEHYTLWAKLKDWANEAKIRLVTTDELRNHQKQARSLEHRTTKSEKRAWKTPVQTHVEVDTQHFKAGDQVVPQIDIAQFAPDAKGLAVVTKEEAAKCLPVRPISSDPLGLIILSNQPIAGVVPITITATDAKKRPILVSAILLNFGDPIIEHKPSLLHSTLVETPVAVIEFVIKRDMVNNWSEVQAPLAYLGLHVPEMRKQTVTETWSIAAYDDSRWRVPHEDAAYVHGYAKVRKEQCDAILRRSGLAGIFLLPRTQDKKKDLAYSLIQLPGKSLDEAISIAKDYPKSLGVVECFASYALRTRREDANEMRTKIHPNSIAIQEGKIAPDSLWFLLKGLRKQTTCEDLTKLLISVGWVDASAIKPKGMAWLICAPQEPPASYMQIDDDLVSIAKIGQEKQSESSKLTGNAQFVPKPNLITPVAVSPASTGPSTASARFDELEDKLTKKMTDMFMCKSAETDEKFGKLQEQVVQQSTAIQDLHKRHDDFAAQQIDAGNKQVETSNKLDRLQESMASDNKWLVQQLKDMFGKVEGRLEKLEGQIADATMNDPNKRQKSS